MGRGYVVIARRICLHRRFSGRKQVAFRVIFKEEFIGGTSVEGISKAMAR